MVYSSTLSLFDEPVSHSLHAAFDAWLSDQRSAGSIRLAASAEVYEDMWDAFCTWCAGQSPAVTLVTLDARDLQVFHDARFGRKRSDMALSPRYALRFMSLIDRVLRHHAAQAPTRANAAASDWLEQHPEVRFAEAAHADPLPSALSTKEARRLITFLSDARPRGTGVSRNAHAAITWQELRNRTSVALQLGAGLTPGDVRALTLESPIARGGKVRERPWKLHVPGDGNSPARETPIAAWAAELLQHWLTIRVEARIAGAMLFPSTRTGKRWHKDSQYLCARRVLEEAGLESAEGGSFRLRHTFALRQLRKGFAAADVARWLGVEPSVIDRYRRIVESPIDVI